MMMMTMRSGPPRPAPALTAEQQALVVSVLLLVESLVRAIAPRAASDVRDDLVQAGRAGAMLAAQRWSPEGGARYSTFARPYIAGGILDHLRADRRARRVFRAASLAARAFVAETPEDFEVVWDDDARLKDRLRSFVNRCLAAMITGASGALPDPEQHAADAELHTRAVRVVQASFPELSEPARKIYRLHYVEGLTLVESAKRLGVAEKTAQRWNDALLDTMTLRLHEAGITDPPKSWPPRGT